MQQLFAGIIDNLEWSMLFSLLLAGLIARLFIPPIVRVSRSKKLMAMESGRVSRKGTVPDMGGIAIFASLSISSSIFVSHGLDPEFQFILPALLIIFFIGLKEDIISINPYSKLGGEVLASLVVIVFADIRITSFHGFLGIAELGLFPSILFSLLLFLLFINSFNLIDGIDGLASGIGIQVSIVFGLWLAFLGQHDYAVFAFALTGGLIPFYFFNVFGKKHKLFMGDTGALLIGLVFAIMGMKIISFQGSLANDMYFGAAPAVVASVIAIPLADTIRIFVYRVARGKSPFKPTRNHLHHYLIGLGFSHWQASTTIIAINSGLFLLAYYIRSMGVIEVGLIVLSLALSVILIFRYILKRRCKKLGLKIT